MNLFYLASMIMVYCCFTVSLINTDRFKHDLRRKIRLREHRISRDILDNLNSYDNFQKLSPRSSSFMLNPRKLCQAIKRYHSVGSFFLVAAILHFSLLFYFLFKVVFHMLMTGADHTQAEYYERNRFFPRLFESHEEPERFYTHCLAICLYCLTCRLICAYRLIRGTWINRDHYVEFYLSQINLAFVKSIDWPIKSWYYFTLSALAHPKESPLHGTDPMRCHLSVNESNIKLVDTLNTTDLVYYVNLIDFSKCYKSTGFRLQQASKRWHQTAPIHRMDPRHLAYIICLYIFGWAVGLSFLVAVGIMSLYFEIDGAVRETLGERRGFIETLRYYSLYLEEPWRLIRLFDLLFFGWVQLPCQVDAVSYYLDAGMLISRANKVTECFERELDLCLRGTASNYFHTVEPISKATSANNQYYSFLLESKKSDDIVLQKSDDDDILTSHIEGTKNGQTQSSFYKHVQSNPPRRHLSVSHTIHTIHFNETSTTKEFSTDNEGHTNCQYQFMNRYSSKNIEFFSKNDLNLKQRREINHRLERNIKMAKILYVEFLDLKRTHGLFVNALMILSGFCIAHCLSQMITATSYSTFFSLTINCLAFVAPISAIIILSVLLDREVSTRSF